jgi:hypothetical protein
MAKIDGPNYTGPTVVDATALKDKLVDLPPKALKGARGPKEGLAEVLKELSTAVPNHGDEAEVHPAVYQRIVDRTSDIDALSQKEMEVLKLLEVIRETRGMMENNREEDISTLGTSVETKSEKDKNPALKAHFEKTIAYKALYAAKAAETRRKNEEAAKAGGEGGGTPTPA